MGGPKWDGYCKRNPMARWQLKGGKYYKVRNDRMETMHLGRATRQPGRRTNGTCDIPKTPLLLSCTGQLCGQDHLIFDFQAPPISASNPFLMLLLV